MTPAPISVERFKLTLVGDINGLIGPFPAVEASPHGDFIHHSDYAALLHQLAEERSYAADTAVRVLKAERALRAAERAREEAFGLLREVASDYGARHFLGDDLDDRIAAFLAASGGVVTRELDTSNVVTREVTVRHNDDGSLDEVVGSGQFHLEQMDYNKWWMQLGPHMVTLTARGKISAWFGKNEAATPASGGPRE